MPSHKRFFCIAALCLLCLAGCEKHQDDDTIISFKGGRLTAADLYAHRDIMLRDSRFNQNPERITPEFVYNHAVNMEMIIAKALEENLHQDPRVQARIHDYMGNLFLEIMQDSLVSPIDRAALTEEEVRAYYDKHIESYTPPTQYAVRIIEHHDAGSLQQMKAEIESGAETFESVARKHSTHNGTREDGGNTGRRPLKNYRPEWRAIIEKLEPSAITGPVQIKNAHYLFELAEKVEFSPEEYEAKKEYVRNDLLYARYREAWEKVYAQLREKYNLTVDEKKLQEFLNQGGKS